MIENNYSAQLWEKDIHFVTFVLFDFDAKSR